MTPSTPVGRIAGRATTPNAAPRAPAVSAPRPQRPTDRYAQRESFPRPPDGPREPDTPTKRARPDPHRYTFGHHPASTDGVCARKRPKYKQLHRQTRASIVAL